MILVRSTFPDITVCLNSMHSKSKILHKYPYLMEALPFYYGQVNHETITCDGGRHPGIWIINERNENEYENYYGVEMNFER